MKLDEFTVEFQVRDYECDFQGIVNNAVYLNYLEHCRHEFAKHLGLNVVALARQGINLVVIRVEMDYKSPLRSGDHFLVNTSIEQYSRIRLAFHQKILHRDTGRLIMTAHIITAAMNSQGKPFFPEELKILFHEVTNLK
ncbi:hypothetical protein U27_02369 [Candidatus Vecturithrix granuli]|uniref:Uncharacterized protein n=1 Tax=Vecturithrix granuli TaxID=1499967 RepID=A0A0S6WAF6_VECG1|nr:hypothetical protein U27_02369 [Candidatus Vecturithrix granuli]